MKIFYLEKWLDHHFSLNEKDHGFIHLDQSQGIEVASHNPQKPKLTGGKEPACSGFTTKKKRKTRLTSPIWSDFVKVKVPNPKGGTDENA